jgi:hypothetical protein
MVVNKVDVIDILPVRPEGDPPVSGDTNGPMTGQIAA